MSKPIVITPGNAVQEVRDLFERPDLARYFPLSRTVMNSRRHYADIPHFGFVMEEQRNLGMKEDTFYMLGRKSRWSMALVMTHNGLIVLNIQPKPGLDAASLEFPGGGISGDQINGTDDIVRLTEEQALRETGYGGGIGTYLGFTLVETGKMFDPEAHGSSVPGVGRGLRAHCVLIQNAGKINEQSLAPTERIQTILVTPGDLKTLVQENVLTEASSIACFTLALMNGHLDRN